MSKATYAGLLDQMVAGGHTSLRASRSWTTCARGVRGGGVVAARRTGESAARRAGLTSYDDYESRLRYPPTEVSFRRSHNFFTPNPHTRFAKHQALFERHCDPFALKCRRGVLPPANLILSPETPRPKDATCRVAVFFSLYTFRLRRCSSPDLQVRRLGLVSDGNDVQLERDHSRWRRDMLTRTPRSRARLTRTPRSLRKVRTVYVHRPLAYRTYLRRREARLGGARRAYRERAAYRGTTQASRWRRRLPRPCARTP